LWFFLCVDSIMGPMFADRGTYTRHGAIFTDRICQHFCSADDVTTSAAMLTTWVAMRRHERCRGLTNSVKMAALPLTAASELMCWFKNKTGLVFKYSPALETLIKMHMARMESPTEGSKVTSLVARQVRATFASDSRMCAHPAWIWRICHTNVTRKIRVRCASCSPRTSCKCFAQLHARSA
jgi:phage gp16-like protein